MFFLGPNNSLKSYVFWRSSTLKSIFRYAFCAPGSQNCLKLKNPVYIDELYNSLKIEVFVWCLKVCVNATLKKKYFETPCIKHMLSVQRGSSCVHFGEKYSFNYLVIANCDYCTTLLFTVWQLGLRRRIWLVVILLFVVQTHTVQKLKLYCTVLYCTVQKLKL